MAEIFGRWTQRLIGRSFPGMTAMDAAPSYKASLLSHDDAFHTLLNLIPAKFYVPAEDTEVESKFQKNKRTKSEKQREAEERKLQTKKAKRDKLDPDNVKTVDELRADSRDDIDIDFEDDEEVEEMEDADESTSEEPPKETPEPHTQQQNTRSASIAELRERLHNKIQSLHNKRQQNSTSEAEAPSTKQELLEARRRQRGEMRDNRRRERKEARRQAKSGAKAVEAKPSTASGSSRSAGLLVHDPSSSAANHPGPLEGKLSFSHVTFETTQAPDTARKNKYALPSDPKAALATLEARKRKEEARIQALVERGEDATQLHEAARENERWGKALAASEGVRIRDNVHHLKQNVKRREKSKERSAKSWNERRKAEQEAQAAKQKRRMENLAARRTGKKPGDKVKKGAGAKARPGFEGSSRSLTGGKASHGSSRASKR